MTKNQLSELFPLGPAIFDPHSLHDPISAIMGGVGLVGNVVGGVLGKSTANRAGDLQQAAGNAAASSITGAVNAANPQIGQAAGDAALQARTAATLAGQNATNAATTGSQQATAAALQAGQGVTAAAGQANALLDPYASAGADASRTLQNGLVAGGDFNKTPTLSDLQIDPGYAFREQQGELALSRSAAARGGATSGEALKDLTNYSQGAASQEYQNAFNRFQTSTQNRYANLSGVANRGISAAGTEGANSIGAAQYAGTAGTNAAQFGASLNTNASEYAGSADTNAAQFAGNAGINAANLMAANSIEGAKTAADYTTSGAAAKANSMIGGANALSAGISGGVNAGLGAVNAANSNASMLKFMNLLRNPAASNAGTNGGMV